MLLISAIPPAAAVPFRYVDGIAQNTVYDAHTHTVATMMAISETAKLLAVKAATLSATALIQCRDRAVQAAFTGAVRAPPQHDHQNDRERVRQRRVETDRDGVGEPVLLQDGRRPEAHRVQAADQAEVPDRQGVTRRSRSTSRRLCVPSSRSTARSRRSSSFSPALSHFARSRVSASVPQTTNASTTHGRPASRNIHCQPCSPATPSKLVISHDDTGPRASNRSDRQHQQAHRRRNPRRRVPVGEVEDDAGPKPASNRRAGSAARRTSSRRCRASSPPR